MKKSVFLSYCYIFFAHSKTILNRGLISELSTGRMDPRVGSGRVGSGHDFAGFWRVGSGRVGSALRIFKFFTDIFLVPGSN